MTKAPESTVIQFPKPEGQGMRGVAEGGGLPPSAAFPHTGDRLDAMALMAAVGLRRFSRFRGDVAEEIKAAHFTLTQAAQLYASLTSSERAERAASEALMRVAAPPTGPDAT